MSFISNYLDRNRFTPSSSSEPSVGFIYEPKCQECVSLFCPDRNSPDACDCNNSKEV